MCQLKLICLSLLFIAGSMFATERAQAACSANVTALNFGMINPVSPGMVDVSATIDYTCTSLISLLSYIKVCIEIAPGSQNTDANNRVLTHTSISTEKLSYNVYSNPARTLVFGNGYSAGSPAAVTKTYGPYTLGLLATARDTQTVYGRISTANPFMQRSVGQYNATLPVTVKMALVSAAGLSPCVDLAPANISLPVNANLISACRISAQPLNFGIHPSNFTSSIASTTTIASSCTKGTPYQIGLNNGLHAAGNQRRMKADDGQFINYELYKDASRSQRWGSTLNTAETLAGVATGVTQNASVYGAVVPQAGLRAADYKDTITVTITY